jgi:hypothetical protein
MPMPSKPIIAWSHSALDTFDLCPKKFYHTKLKKDFKESFNSAADYGQQAHKHFEDRLLLGKKLPLDLMQHETFLARIAAAPGDKYGEQKLAINNRYEPTGFFDSDVYGRAVVDYMIVHKHTCLIFDWKFGKMKDEDDQLRLFIGFASIFFPEVTDFVASYYWAKDKCFTRLAAKREELTNAVWHGVTQKVQRLELAVKTTDFPPRPNGLCKKYCPVTTCPHNGG